MAGLPEKRGLLVAGDAAYRNFPPKPLARGRAEIIGAIAHFRQNRGRHAERAEQFLVPALFVDVKQQSAPGVAGVGEVPPAQTPQQKRVNRAERQLARLGAAARAVHRIQNPGDFRRGKIRVQQ